MAVTNTCTKKNRTHFISIWNDEQDTEKQRINSGNEGKTIRWYILPLFQISPYFRTSFRVFLKWPSFKEISVSIHKNFR